MSDAPESMRPFCGFNAVVTPCGRRAFADETPGREFVDRARAALPAGRADQAAEIGRRLSVRQVLDLARRAEPGGL